MLISHHLCSKICKTDGFCCRICLLGHRQESKKKSLLTKTIAGKKQKRKHAFLNFLWGGGRKRCLACMESPASSILWIQYQYFSYYKSPRTSFYGITIAHRCSFPPPVSGPRTNEAAAIIYPSALCSRRESLKAPRPSPPPHPPLSGSHTPPFLMHRCPNPTLNSTQNRLTEPCLLPLGRFTPNIWDPLKTA